MASASASIASRMHTTTRRGYRTGARAPLSSRLSLVPPGVKQAVQIPVGQGLPGRLDDVARHTDRGPLPLAVGGVDQHADRSAGADVLVEHADPVVLQGDVLELGVLVRQGLAKRVVQGADGTVTLRALDVAAAAGQDLDGGLGP